METISYKIGSNWTETSLLALGVGETWRMSLGTHGESKVVMPFPGLAPETALPIPFEALCILRTGRTLSGGSYSGGTILFQGRRTDNSGVAEASNISQELVIEDAWYDLRLLTYAQPWANITGMGGTLTSPTYTFGTPFTWPDCVLFQCNPGAAGQFKPDGTFAAYSPAPADGHITTGQTVEEILAFAIYFGGVNLQIGTLADCATYVPFYPVRSCRCAEAILHALRVHPDCTSEIDYTTTPPTFNIRKAANLTAATLPYKGSGSGVMHLTSQVRPRPDLQVPRVAVYFKVTSTINGTPVVGVGVDIAPSTMLSVAGPVAIGFTVGGAAAPYTAAGTPVVGVALADVGTGSPVTIAVGAPISLRSLDASCDMTGPKVAKTAGVIETAAFDPTSQVWWMTKVPALNDQANGGQIPNSGPGALTLMDSTINGGLSGHAKGIQVVDDTGAAIDLTTYAYELLAGTPANWMQLSGGVAVDVVEANVVAFFSYNKETTLGGSNILDQIGEHMHTCRVKLCNVPAPGDMFTSTTTLATGEIYPSGLAASILAALAALQYNFTHTILDAPFSTLIKPGKNSLNLSGGAAAWSTMNAMVQGVTMEVMSYNGGLVASKTTVKCGPVAHLDAGQLIELFNMFTRRDLNKINYNERSNGQDDGGGNVTLGNDGPKENSVPAHPVPAETNHVVVSGGAVAAQTIQSAPMVQAILAATTPTPFTGFSATDVKTMKPREVKMCDDSGNVFFAIVQMSGGYTKP